MREEGELGRKKVICMVFAMTGQKLTTCCDRGDK
jgi:hypothetical protein